MQIVNKKSKYWLTILILFIGILPSSASSAPMPMRQKLLYVINRLSFGASPGDIEKVQSMGVEKYIQEQLSPDSIPESQSLTNQLSQLETLRLSSKELGQEYSQFTANGRKATEEELKARQSRMRQILAEATQARLLRAVESPRQLQEVMVDFWFNHFNVYANKGRTKVWVGTYERDAIRPYAFGKFRDLLEATARHPAMLFYLDNWQNTAPKSPGIGIKSTGLNENYARELMELHTLGVDGGYTQQDVISLAKILTGWGLSRGKQGNDSGFLFDAKRHDFSDKVFLGHTIKGSGEAEGEEALDILAKHPATARHISYELAQYFVSDNPPSNLVKQLQQRYLATDGDIREVLKTLFRSPEFWNAKNYSAKFKTPYQYVISAVRATGVEINNTKPLANNLQQLGMPLFGCQTPDGYKNTEQAWLNPDGMTRRISFATSLASGRLLSTQPVDASQLINTVGNISPKTQSVINSNSPQLQGALILGSPEFMRR